MINAQLRGSDCIRQFVFGSPSGGDIKRYTYPLDSRAKDSTALKLEEIFSPARARFDERARKAGSKNTESLWE